MSWSCTACTFFHEEDDSSLQTCAACGTPREAGAPSPGLIEEQMTQPDTPDDPISNIMSQARQANPAEREASFSGRGRTLSADESGSDAKEKKVHVTFYKDGFTVEVAEDEVSSAAADRGRLTSRSRNHAGAIHTIDSGTLGLDGRPPPPLRPYETDESRMFVQKINSNHVPEELHELDERRRPRPVSLMLSDRREQACPHDYSRQRATSFGGQGFALGGTARPVSPKPAPTMMSTVVSVVVRAWRGVVWLVLTALFCTPGGAGLARRLGAKFERPVADPALPTTTIQVRLSSGRRTRLVINHSQTVDDLYCMVEHETKQEGGSEASFDLVSGFPPTILDDRGASITQAGLLNASITARTRLQ